MIDAQASIDSARRARDLPAASLSASYGPGSGTSRSGLSASLNLNSGLASASYTQPLSIGGSTGSTSGSGGGSFALGLTASFNILDPGADGTLKLADLQLQQAQAALTVQGQTVDQNALDAYSTAQHRGAGHPGAADLGDGVYHRARHRPDALLGRACPPKPTC